MEDPDDILKTDRAGGVVIVLLLITTGAFGALLLDLLTIGPGYPPLEALQKWYIPQPRYGYAENGSMIVNRTISGDLVLLGDIEERCPPLFPVLSRRCSYAMYADTGWDDRYLVVNWYFDDNADLLQAEMDLCNRLRAAGNVSFSELIPSKEPDPSQSEPIFDRVAVTRFESETSSGYFTVVEKPLSPEHDDYFIAYFGVVGSAPLSDHTAALEDLMLRSYSFNGARPLAFC
ncbi:MAG: hypothetical protein CVV31_13720 [Methanomicrobiales archaeon HGW-Methanomicrobiales-2]|nr:MAG: hypothetical protein CVV34_03775 [Methanomicrobiales archaeon HGW-Methanomicrobiales-5]PKL61011.1 MAG: hypothetical protein CVV31_13720 [Methanomicrobiales archaeon HGW-Methanomicrobiales-2]